MGFLVPRIVVVFVNRPLTIQGADWPAQLLEKDTNGLPNLCSQSNVFLFIMHGIN